MKNEALGVKDGSSVRQSSAKMVNVYTIISRMGRPPKPENLRRDKMLPLRLTEDEWNHLRMCASNFGVKVSEILREGAKLYIHERDKGGSLKIKEKER